MPPSNETHLPPDPPVTRVVVAHADRSAGDRPAPWLATIGLAMLAIHSTAWLGGHLGEDLFAALVGGEGLRVSHDLGWAAGWRTLVGVPHAILELARLEPAWFGLGSLLAIVPLAGLVAARPDAERTGGTTSLAATALLLAGAVFLGILLWLDGTTRGDVLAVGVFDAKGFPEWIGRLERIAGLDWMLLLVACAWTALSIRLPLPAWSRVLGASLGGLVAFACWYGGVRTLGTIEQFDRPRPMAFAGTSDAAREPVLGTIGDRPVAMGGGEFPGLHTVGESRVAFSSPQSLREFLTPPVE